MGNLRYASVRSDRLYDSVEDRYFITEKLAVEKMNEALERAARYVESAAAANADDEGCEVSTSTIMTRIRALKENV